MLLSYKPERRIVIALLLLQSVGLLGLSVFVLGGKWAATTMFILVSTGLMLCSLVLYLAGVDWARLCSVAIVTLVSGFYLPEPFVTSYAPFGLMVAPALAMVLASTAWMIGVAIVQIVLLLGRAGFTGVYTEPLTLALYTMVIGTLVIARIVTNMARARAEEQSRLLAEERTHLEQRVAERTRELQAANAELRQANQLRDLFLASVSHELRTPLNIILGGVELLREEIYGGLSPRQHQSLETVAESGHHLLHLINDILDLAKMGSGTFEIDLDLVEVRDLCEQCARMIGPSAERKGLQFELRIEEGIGQIEADYRRLRQILLNLLSNAIKFTPEGRIGLEVACVKGCKQIEFVVWDTGIGIAPELQSQLFQPFSQLDRRLARQYEGTGLGLALVAQLVARHGGTVGVSSVPKQGSRFWVRLPAA
jgi:signal transduction histidine kinase